MRSNAAPSSHCCRRLNERYTVRLFYGCSYMFTCPAITVVTVILRALDRVRERVLGLLCLSCGTHAEKVPCSNVGYSLYC